MADLLEMRAQGDSLGDAPLEALVRPYAAALSRCVPIFFGKITRGDRPRAGILNCDPLDELAEITNVAGIGTI